MIEPIPPELLRLDRRLAAPLHRQIYERIRGAILSGQLPAGARLPSSRSLASQLAASRATVQLAYELLAGEGYVVGRAAAGTVVAPRLALPPAPARRREPPADSLALRMASGQPPLPFQLGLPALDAFPRKLWSRLAARRARGLTTASMVYQPPGGLAPLRQAIVRYLALARGIDCSADEVVITAGFQGALALLAHLLLQPGDPVWVEDPGYFLAREGLALAGARLVPVPIDAEGFDVAAAATREPARLALVTPAHQQPLGVALSLSRRLALLAWAEAADAWIVEDDYDSEYRYEGRPLPALKSLDRAGRVLYVGTFSKVLFPGLRLGYVVAPAALADRLVRGRGLLGGHQSTLDQMTVTDFMTEGHFARHVKRMRLLYGERRAALADALTTLLGDRLAIELPPGGMHLLARPVDGADDVALSRRARDRGLAVESLSPLTLEGRGRPGLMLSFTNIPAEDAEREVRRLRSALFTERR